MFLESVLPMCRESIALAIWSARPSTGCCFITSTGTFQNTRYVSRRSTGFAVLRREANEGGFFRPIVQEVVGRYLDCGNPRSGFALMIRCRLMRTAKRCPAPVHRLPCGTPVDIFLQDPRLLPVVSRQEARGVGRVDAGGAAPGCPSSSGRLHHPQDAEDLLQVQEKAPRGALPVSRQGPHGLPLP